MLTIKNLEHDISQEYEVGKYSIGSGFWDDVRIKSKKVEKSHLTLDLKQDGFTIRSKVGFELSGQVIHKLDTPKSGSVLTIGDVDLTLIHFYQPGADFDSIPNSDSKLESSEVESNLIEQTKPDFQIHQFAELPSFDVKIKNELQDEIRNSIDLFKREEVNQLNEEALREETTQLAYKAIKSGKISLPGDIDVHALIKETVAEAIGLGALEPLLHDETVSEVMVNGPENIYIEQNGEIYKTSQVFSSPSSLLRVIERIVAPLGRRIDEASPMVDARLADGSRVNAIIPPLSLIGPVITIRKFSKNRLLLEDLQKFGSLTPQMTAFLKVCVEQRKNIVVCGGTGSGKTTFLNALSDYIPDEERIVTIEDAAELQLAQDHVISLESRPANIEGSGEITIRDLVKNSLRMRPDRIIVGECRSGEALDMLQAMNTGHDGSMTTAHANSPRDLLSRLEVMVLMAGMDMPVRVIREQISSAVDIIVHQGRFADGRRRVTSIVEVCGMEDDVVLMQSIFEFKRKGFDAEGKIDGDHISTGTIPNFYTELRDSGINLDIGIFNQ